MKPVMTNCYFIEFLILTFQYYHLMLLFSTYKSFLQLNRVVTMGTYGTSLKWSKKNLFIYLYDDR